MVRRPVPRLRYPRIAPQQTQQPLQPVQTDRNLRSGWFRQAESEADLHRYAEARHDNHADAHAQS